ncbi:GCN5-related N-acetyltransferase [Kribbella flavida DSM 17836]|uniref:GCN5-related N-acetyltransferase n=1 Tax=Kribbella flavida (strain DSM 17836 / JCM 10339 / NBRC 14399) TaxID=479435 RepID=D2PUE0_KRIFD|nr:GNAT family N-acetyltransferase [Kribbella flavida]ADB35191.1 GCN5-related N-acetyltransferase [Kribbella flavida DSM 17836]
MSDNRVTVRRAVDSDEPALLEIELTAWDATSGFPSLTAGGRTNFFTERSGPAAHLVAEQDGRLVGYIRLQDKYPFEEGAGVLAVNGLAVAVDARGRGIGSVLLDAVTAEAQRRGARKIALHVHGVNTVARRLYERHGYVVEGTHPREFLIDGQYVDAVDLALYLDV